MLHLMYLSITLISAYRYPISYYCFVHDFLGRWRNYSTNLCRCATQHLHL